MCAENLMQRLVEKLHCILPASARSQRRVPLEVLNLPVNRLQIGLIQLVKVAVKDVEDKRLIQWRIWLDAYQRLKAVVGSGSLL